METIIKLSDICFQYEPTRPLLKNINLELKSGEKIGLVGANGCGKTTLLHLVVGLQRINSGEIKIFNKIRREEKDFADVRAKIGLLFQDPEDQLFCPTVWEDIAFGPLNLGKDHHKAMHIVADTLESLGLKGYDERITYKLSGGEKRLVSLASILAMQPEVLLLDEPICGLDEKTSSHIIDILSQLPLSMIIISHERTILEKLTTRTILLQNGNIL